MNLHLRTPKQEAGEPHWQYAQRLADHAKTAANISLVFAAISLVACIVALVLA